MAIDFVRGYCLSLPHATETLQWESLVFKIGGKVFAIAPLEPAGAWLTFKCTPDDFADLTERIGIIPAPYLGHAKWAALETDDALSTAEVKKYLRLSYDLVLAKLSRKAHAALSSAGKKSSGGSTPRRSRGAGKKAAH